MNIKLWTFCLFFLLADGLYRISFGQSKNDILITPETPPVFPGGDIELFCFIDKHINKPLLLTVDTIGTAIAQFTVDTLGQVKDIKIIKSLSAIVDNELLRIIGLMPKWTPGKYYDIATAVNMNLPLKIPLSTPYDKKFCR